MGSFHFEYGKYATNDESLGEQVQRPLETDAGQLGSFLGHETVTVQEHERGRVRLG